MISTRYPTKNRKPQNRERRRKDRKKKEEGKKRGKGHPLKSALNHTPSTVPRR